MSIPIPQKIVYLFGAGATHGELAHLENDPSEEIFNKKRGLLINYVSNRVIEKAQSSKIYLTDIEMISGAKGPLNIELLISLIENSRIIKSEFKSRMLKVLVRKDIEAILTKPIVAKFYLHKALLELHRITRKKEELLGLISLNYDAVLDKAYQTVHGERPNYSLSLIEGVLNKSIPLLKLHGSFNWERVPIRGRNRSVEIIPLGASKNYLHTPYNFIWGRALELLIQCDILRVVGCSLSPNDIHLIDLLFKAHLERGKAFEIQIIGWEKTGENIQNNYGFFPNIKRLTQIESSLIPDPKPKNAFKTWLECKARKMLRERVKKTIYLKRLVV